MLCWKKREEAFSFFLGISQRDLGLNLLGRLAAVLKVFHLRIIFLNINGTMDFKLFGNDVPRLMGNNDYLFKITAHVFPPWHCFKAYKWLREQTAKTSALSEVLTLAGDQLFKGI